MPYRDPEKAKAAKKEWDRKHRNGKRHQVWLAIFYEEDCPGWEQEIEELGVPCLVSPPHDRDTWTEHDANKYSSRGIVAGAKKKKHRHLVSEYPSPVSYDQFKSDFGFLAAPGKELSNIKWGRSISASTLYLAHETKACERLGKAKYDPTLILEFCGANYMEWKSRIEDVHGQMKAMRKFIRENSVTEFCEFQDWCDEENDEWSWLLDMKCSWAIGNYIDRFRNKLSFEQAAGMPPAGGLSATPPQGASEPRTPNPDGKTGKCDAPEGASTE